MLGRWLAATAALSVAASGAAASHSEGVQYAYGRVIDVQPIVRYVTVERPRRECWEETVYEPLHPYGVAGPTIAGGIVGGAIGRQFGGGSGRDALTLIGAFVGSAVANQRAVRNQADSAQVRAVPVERCEVTAERFTEERVDAYRVTYEYDGRRYTMRTSEPPGDRVRLQISVRPAYF